MFCNNFSARHNPMTKVCRALFKCENNLKIGQEKIMHSFQVLSNESACRKSGLLGTEQVFMVIILYMKMIKQCYTWNY